MRRMIDPKIEMLRDAALFSGCTDKELGSIAQLVDVVEFPPDYVLMREGRPGRECFVLIRGRVRVTIGDRDVAELGEGEAVGEMALVDREVRSATVTTLEPTKAFVVDPSGFSGLLANHKAVARKLMATLVGRIRDLEHSTV